MTISILRFGLSVLLLSAWGCDAFVPVPSKLLSARATTSTEPSPASSAVVSVRRSKEHSSRSTTRLHLDLVSYLRTEWIAAALFTNQTPRSADVCLQLGTEDGRAVTFIPRTITTLITSSADADGKITVGATRQLKQNQETRRACKVQIVDQYADDLVETNDESVDVVVSYLCAQRLADNGRDWKASIREAARVLKPGGRLLWVEQTELPGGDYLQYLENLYTQSNVEKPTVTEGDEASSEEEKEDDGLYAVWEDIGWDDVDLVLTPHRAGVAIKAIDPAVIATMEEDEMQTKMADLSLSTFERGIKKRKKKKKKKKKKSIDEE